MRSHLLTHKILCINTTTHFINPAALQFSRLTFVKDLFQKNNKAFTNTFHPGLL